MLRDDSVYLSCLKLYVVSYVWWFYKYVTKVSLRKKQNLWNHWRMIGLKITLYYSNKGQSFDNEKQFLNFVDNSIWVLVWFDVLFTAFHPINQCYNIGAFSITCNKCKFLQTKILHFQRQTTVRFFIYQLH